MKQEVHDYCTTGNRWDSAVDATLGRESVAGWLKQIGADRQVAAGMAGLRGFFLADPEDLSLLQLVDQFASGGAPGESGLFRVRGGNDRLTDGLARALKRRPILGTVLRTVRQDTRGVTLGIMREGRGEEIVCDYLVSSLPASTLHDVRFTPALPEVQQRAFSTLRYGCATRVVLQFARAFWRKVDRPRAFGSDLPIGAVWDGAEGQRRGHVLTFLAGGSASAEFRRILAEEGDRGVLDRLSWLGSPYPIVDRWSRGGYAYFDPGFDPCLREWLARPAGRVVFAGEHTRMRWQGFMSGAIESGRRAAAEIPYLAASDTART